MTEVDRVNEEIRKWLEIIKKIENPHLNPKKVILYYII